MLELSSLILIINIYLIRGILVTYYYFDLDEGNDDDDDSCDDDYDDYDDDGYYCYVAVDDLHYGPLIALIISLFH